MSLIVGVSGSWQRSLGYTGGWSGRLSSVPSLHHVKNQKGIDPSWFIDQVLEADKRAPRKQRHTAKRIYTRIKEELLLDVSESTVRKYVQERKRQLRFLIQEAFVPQEHLPGEEGEADWYQAQVLMRGEPLVVQVFVMRSRYSSNSLHVAFARATQQAFLQAHQEGFHYLAVFFIVCAMTTCKADTARASET